MRHLEGVPVRPFKTRLDSKDGQYVRMLELRRRSGIQENAAGAAGHAKFDLKDVSMRSIRFHLWLWITRVKNACTLHAMICRVEKSFLHFLDRQFVIVRPRLFAPV